MIKVVEKSREFNAVEIYLMTIAPSRIAMKDVPDDTVIPVDGILTFEYENKNTGEIIEIMSVITNDKTVYACQSKTFKNSLRQIKEIMGEKKFSIIKKSGITKAGRDYIDCYLDVTTTQ